MELRLLHITFDPPPAGLVSAHMANTGCGVLAARLALSERPKKVLQFKNAEGEWEEIPIVTVQKPWVDPRQT